MPSFTDRLHAAIIMDGNGRWATTRGLPRIAGHRAGAEALRRTVEAAPDAGIGTLTVYAFSSDNWRRPPTEVSALMRLFQSYLRKEQARCIQNGVRISVIGRRDRLPRMLLPAIETAERVVRTVTIAVARLGADVPSTPRERQSDLRIERRHRDRSVCRSKGGNEGSQPKRKLESSVS